MTQRCIVTGGSGFVGKALAIRLAKEGWQVTTLSRRPIPELADLGVNVVQCDLTSDLQSIKHIFRGVDAVFHVAAKVDMWGPYGEFFKHNVLATRELMRLAREGEVSCFIYTSSPSVIADGKNLKGVDESYPYPLFYKANYPKTKAMAEREVLASNSPTFFTLALRPHLIFGPNDTNLIPTIIERARAGKLVKIGNGKNLVDFTYIGDCVDAHIKAFYALKDNPNSRGKAYFISQGEPVPMWDWIDDVLQRAGLPKVSKRISKKVAMSIARCCEFATKISKGARPLMTRFLVSEMSTDHYFSLDRAIKELGFRPKYSIREALDLTFGETGKNEDEAERTSVIAHHS